MLDLRATDDATASFACGQLAEACGDTPWVLLGGGADTVVFLDQVRLAGAAGASGFLVGRGIWVSALDRDPDVVERRAERLARDEFARCREAAADRPPARRARVTDRVPMPRLVYNSNSTMHLPVRMQVRLARETGWDGVFLRAEHIRRYSALASPRRELRDLLARLRPVNLGALPDVERWRPTERAAMLREAEALTELAVSIGASFVQVLSGPVSPGGAYDGPGRADLRTASAGHCGRPAGGRRPRGADTGSGIPGADRVDAAGVRWPTRSRPSRRPVATTSGSSSTSGTSGTRASSRTTSPGSTGA